MILAANLHTIYYFSWGRSSFSFLGVVHHKAGSQVLPEVEGVCHEQSGQLRASTSTDRCSNSLKVLVPSVGTSASHAVQRAWKAGFIELVRDVVERLLTPAFKRGNVVENPIVAEFI